MELFEKFEIFINSIKKDDNLAIFYHTSCVDGLCSCVITSKAITKLTGIKPLFHIPHLHELNNDTLEFIKKNEIKKVIYIDLIPDRYPEVVKEAEKYAELLIIDHHKFKTNLDSKKTLLLHAEYINSKLDGAQYPASKLTYDIFLKLTDLEDLDWLACVGLIGDSGYSTWKEFVLEVINRHNLEQESNLFNGSDFGKCAALLSGATMYGGNSDLLFDIVYKSENFKDILQNKILIGYDAESKAELRKWILRTNEAEIYGDLVIFEIKPKLKINSTLSTVLSFEQFKDKTLIIIMDYFNDGFLTISARDQRKKIKLNELLNEAVADLPESSSGGHIPAAGATIRKEDKDKFKKKLIQLYNNLNK